MLAKINLTTKVLCMIAMIVAWALCVIGWTCFEWRASAYSAKQNSARQMVDGAYALTAFYGNLASSGKMSLAEAQKRARDVLRQIRFDQGNYIWMSDLNSRIVLHPAKPELEGTDQTHFIDPSGFALFPACVAASGTSEQGSEVRYLWPKAGSSLPVRKVTWVRRYGPWGWVIGVGLYADDVDREMQTAFGKVWGVAVASLAAVFGIALFLLRTRVAKPLREAVRVLRSVAEGDLTQRLTVISEDEIGQMSRALNQAIQSQRETLSEVALAADEVSQASSTLAEAAGGLSSGIHTQAACVVETSASLKELTATVRTNASGAQRAEVLARNSRRVADLGGTVAASTMAAMSEIGEASRRILEITSTMDEIAFQTNILALNAAVEAARVGHEGRGFAVVAAEIRALSQRSARASKEIQQLLNDSSHKVDAGDKMVRRSGETFSEIASAVADVLPLVEAIATASTQQAIGIDQLNQAVSQIDQVSQATLIQTDELWATAAGLQAQAVRVRQLVSHFRLAS